MQKEENNNKKKKTKKKIGKEREIARDYQVYVCFVFFLNSDPTFWLQEPAEVIKKSLNIIMHANILKDHANKLIPASY